MEVLMQIKEENGQQLVSGRELHKKLEIKSRYNDWIKNAIKNYGFIENTDFTAITQFLVTAQEIKEFISINYNKKASIGRKY